MFNTTKIIKYSAINFDNMLKHNVTFELKWIDSSYDLCQRHILTDITTGRIIRDVSNTKICVSMQSLAQFIKTMQEIDQAKGYFTNIKGLL